MDGKLGVNSTKSTPIFEYPFNIEYN